MYFLGGGLGIYLEGFFLDLSGKKFLNGSDNASFSLAQFEESDVNFRGWDTFQSLQYQNDVDIDRSEYAVSVGYNILEGLSIFGGWKWADTELEYLSDGTYGLVINPDEAGATTILEANVKDNGKRKFQFNGPFLGLAYGIPVLEAGGLSLKFGVAKLEGELTNRSTVKLTNIRANDIPLAGTEEFPLGNDVKGDSIGWNVGIAWNGTTPVEGLGYTVGVDAYQYKFEAKDFDQDVNERLISFNLGANYAF